MIRHFISYVIHSHCKSKIIPWWRLQMEAFSALLARYAVMRSFDVFLGLRKKKRLSRQWRRRWFDTPSKFYDATVVHYISLPFICRHRGADIDHAVPADVRVHSEARPSTDTTRIMKSECVFHLCLSFIDSPFWATWYHSKLDMSTARRHLNSPRPLSGSSTHPTTVAKRHCHGHDWSTHMSPIPSNAYQLSHSWKWLFQTLT